MTDLSAYSSARQLVEAFEREAAVVRQCFAELAAAEDRLNAAFLLGENDAGRLRVCADGGTYRDNFKNAERAVKLLEGAAWERVVDRLGIKRFLSIKAAEDLSSRLRKNEMPPLTLDEIAKFAQGYINRIEDLNRDAVLEVFNWLRPRGWTSSAKLKANSAPTIGPKTIVEYGCKRWTRFEHDWAIDYDAEPKFRALENVLHALDGRGMIQKTHYSQMWTAVREQGAEGETEFFRYKCHKNGRVHLEWKRRDLLAKFNAVAGGKNLKPSEAA